MSNATQSLSSEQADIIPIELWFRAAYDADLAQLYALAGQGLDPNCCFHRPTAGRWNALIECIRSHRFEAIDTLIELSGGRYCDAEGWNALMHAAYEGSVEVVKKLIPHSDPHQQSIGNDENALMLAVESGHLDCVELLAPLIDLWHANHQGLTAVDMAEKLQYWGIHDYLNQLLLCQMEQKILQQALASPPSSDLNTSHPTMDDSLPRSKPRL